MNQVLDNLIVFIVIIGVFFIAYVKITGKTFGEIIADIREGFSDKTEEVIRK